MADGSIIIDTKLDGDALESAMKGLGSIATKALTAATAAVSSFAAYAVKAGMEFSAVMSEVESLSGATGKQLEALSDIAKEMGETTKFSAAESAEALTFMAQAGWETEKMIEALPAVILGAAASGEDLAMVSSIVTDNINAFGMAASEAAHMMDVLAMAGAATNTDIASMGESLKYVAPIAGTLNYSIEEISHSLGLMANAGIKSSQAGTSLRSALTSLVQPTGATVDAMEELGLLVGGVNVAMVDSTGASRSWDGTLQILRNSFDGLTAAQKAEYAATIFGTQAMSGMLAILNTSDEEYAKLTDTINNASGAAQEMADVMMDNLAGDMTTLKSGIEGLGITIYENLEQPLRDLAKSASVAVEEINKAFKTGNFNDAIDTVGRLLIDVIDEMLSYVPDFMQTGADLLKALIKGISDNAKQLTTTVIELGKIFVNTIIQQIPLALSAGKDIINAFIDGMAESFPKLENTFNAIKGIFNAVFDTLSNVIGNIIESLKNSGVFEKVLELINNIANSISNITPLLEVLGSVITFVADIAIKGLNLVLEILNDLFEAIATILSAVIGATEHIDYLSESTEKLVVQIKAANEEYKNSVEQIQEYTGNVDGLVSSMESLLAIEERSAAEESLLQEIIAELNESIPNLGLAYDDLSGSINLTTEQVRALIDAQEQQALAEAKLQLYTESYKQQIAIQSELNKASAEYQGIQSERLELEAKREELQKRLNQELLEQKDTAGATADEIAGLTGKINELNEKEDIAWTTVKKLSVQNDELTNKTQKLGDEYDEFIETMSDGNDVVEETEDGLDDVSDSADGAAEAIDDLTTALKSAAKSMEDYENAIDPLNSKINLLESNLKVIKSEYDDVNDSQEAIARVTETLTDIIDEQTNAIDITVAAQEDYRNAVADLEAENAALEQRMIGNLIIMQELAETGDQGSDKYLELAAANEEFSNQLIINTALIAENLSFIDDLQLKINNYTIANNSYRQEIDRLGTTTTKASRAASSAAKEAEKAAREAEKAAKETSKPIIESIKSISKAVQDLTKEYDNAYKSAYDSAMGQLDLFAELAGKANDTFKIDVQALRGLSDGLASGAVSSIDDMLNAIQKSGEDTEMYVSQFVQTISQLDPAVEYTFDELKALFVDVAEDTGKTTDLMIENMQRHAKEVVQYNADLNRAIEAGFAEGFVETLTDGSEDSKKALQAILDEYDALMNDGGLDSGKAAEFVGEFNAAFADTEWAADQLASTVAEMQTDFTEKSQELIKQAQEMADEVSGYTGDSFEELRKNLDSLMTDVANMSKVKGGEIISGLVDGLDESKDAAVDDMRAIASSMDTAFATVLKIESPSKVFFESGVNIVQGLINGVNSMVGGATAAISTLAQSLITAFNHQLEIHSPSMVMYKSGENVVQGVADGINDNQYLVEDSMDKMADTVTSAMDRTNLSVKEARQYLLDLYNAATRFEKIDMATFERLFTDFGVFDSVNDTSLQTMDALVNMIGVNLATATVEVERFKDAVYGLDREIMTVTDTAGRMFQVGNMPGQNATVTNSPVPLEIRQKWDEEYRRITDQISNMAHHQLAGQIYEEMGESVPKAIYKINTAMDELGKTTNQNLKTLQDDFAGLGNALQEDTLQKSIEFFGENMTDYRDTLEVAKDVWEIGGEAWDVYENHIKQQETVVDLQKQVNEQFARLIESGTTDTVNGMVVYNQAAIQSYTELIAKLAEAQEALIDTTAEFDKLAEAIADGTVDALYGVAEGLEENKLIIRDVLINAADTEEWGKYAAQMMSEGFQVGVYDEYGNLIDAVKYFTEGIKETIETDLDINSPSGYAEWAGKMLMQGMSNGIIDNLGGVIADMSKVNKSIQAEMDKISSIQEVEANVLSAKTHEANLMASSISNTTNNSTYYNPTVQMTNHFGAGVQPTTRYQELKQLGKITRNAVRGVLR